MLFQTQFLLALVTTWIIEIPVLFGLLRIVFRDRTISRMRIIFAGILCTALTLPYLWFIIPPYVNLAYYTVIGETLVIIIEAIILNRVLGLQPKAAVTCSAGMNIASYVFGLFLL
jgi:hypothetical protein